MKRYLKSILLAALLSMMAVAVYAAVEINFFIGEWVGDAVVLEWQSATELDHAAFQVWRSETNLPVVDGQIDTSQADPVSALIPAIEPCGTTGHDYQFTDDTVESSVGVYYYYLQVTTCLPTSPETAFYEDEQSDGLPVEQPQGSLLFHVPLLAR
jgi:hypothetical protein